MSIRQHPAVNENQQVPYNPLPYYPYPPYEYPSSSMYNPAHGYLLPPVYTDPNMYPVPEYYDSRRYFPINDMMATTPYFPHIVDSYYDEHHPSLSYRSDRSTRGSHKHRHRRKNHHHHHHHHHRHHQDYWHAYSSPKPERHEILPPIHQHPFTLTRALSPNDDKYEQFFVHNLTDRDLLTSGLSPRTAIRKIQRYDQLKNSYQ